ncbi:MAG: BTAD domain-containing putative transcriptional regulator [Oscillochloridaceae bacterium]|nr:transcriptional regulator [Chloroflexaceae bacterium]MDW8390870.1 BTAD domain-containing putative transcriptional regulator [Oscillochloridaceae bacterium]
MTQVAAIRSASQPGPALLPLKLSPPVPRSETLLRPDLQALLAEVRLRPVTLVVAPAGYGKTTLLAQWADELQRTGAHVLWLGLDAEDQAPSLLLAYLVRAFQRHLPEVGEESWRVIHSAADLERDWPVVAGALLSELQTALTTPTFLIIDDLHLISDGPITTALIGYLLRAAPPALHVILASRRMIDISPLPRMRAEGALVEVEQGDLSLNREEAAELLARAGVHLPAGELDLLLQRTEGWVLSVQLAARALARLAPEQRRTYLETLDSSERSLFDYLASEVLANLPPDLLEFLAQAALTDQFDAPLIAEVLGRPDAEALINRCVQLGLPISPVDTGESGAPTYRFHPLWSRLLRERAQQTLGPQALVELHTRYGAAFERRSRLEVAMAHYSAAGDDEAMAGALRRRAWPLIESPQRDSIRAWLESLPVERRERDAELLHMWGWSMAASHPDQALQAISRAAELYSREGNYQRELRALSDVAALIFWEGRPADFADVCVRAVRAANRVRDTWARGAALASTAALLYSRGRYAAALRVAAHATRHPRSVFWQWLLAMIVSSIHTQQGYPEAALTAIGQALEMPQVERDDRLHQNLLLLKALALYQQGQISEAVFVALDAYRRLSVYEQQSVIGVSAAFLALLLAEQGEIEEATTYLSRARSIANANGLAALLTRARVIEAYLARRSGQEAAATAAALDLMRHARAVGADLATAAATRRNQAPGDLAPPAQSTHDLWLQLYLLVVLGEGGETERAANLAAELAAEMLARGDGLFLASVQIYRAALEQRLGHSEAALEALRAGWNLCERHRFGFLPGLPQTVVEQAVASAIEQGLAPEAVGQVLRRQIPRTAPALLMQMLSRHTTPAIRARIATLLGDLGSAQAYATLRTMLKERHPDVRSAAESSLERLVYRPAYRLNVRTLGAFGVWRGDVEIRDRDWRSIKARQLLQLLLVERGRMLPRDRIMDMLWPGLETEAAANNLRVTLSRLTKAIEPNRPEGAPMYYILQQGDTYGFNIESDHGYDAAEFSEAVEQGRAALQRGQRAEAIARFRHAISLYGGPFLPDCLYEDWSVVERERLELLFTEASLRLGALLLEDGNPHEAIGLAWRVLEYDQAQEEAYQLLMRAYGILGERSTALRLYNRCVAALHQELGVEPLPETVAIYQKIRGNHPLTP